MSSNNPIEDFRDALRAAGMTYAGDLLADGKLHRFKAEGDKQPCSWYVLHVTDKFAAAGFGCWKRNLNEKWNNANGNATQLTPKEWQDIRNRMNAAEAARRTEEEQLRYEAKKRALQILSEAKPVEDHLYLLRKSVAQYGEMRIAEKDFFISKDWILEIKNCLCLPLRDEQGVLHSMQFIAPDKRFKGDRDKDFIFGGRANGSFYEIPGDNSGPLVICEGYATGASIYDATGYTVICAMFSGNLLAVGQALRKKYPDRTILFAADNDRFTSIKGEPYNTGLVKATEAAKAINAAIAIPAFSDVDNDGTDFNDLAELSGKKIVQQTIEIAYKDFLMPKFIALPKVDNAADMYADESIKEPEQLIKGLLHQGLKMVIGSGSKAYKSWILLDIMVSVAGGTQWWMFGTTKGKVLYLNFEIPRWSIKLRLIEMATKKGVGIEALTNIDIWSLRGYATELFKLLPDLMKQIKYGGYALVVLDPIYKVLGEMDENAAGDIAKMCNELEKICVQSGAAVLYAAHFSKGNQSEKEAMDRIGGSGVFGRDPDAIVTLTKHEQDDAYTVDCILRNLPRVNPFVMKLEFPLYVEQPQEDPEALKRPGKKKEEESDPETMALLLSDGSLSSKNWQRRSLEEYGISRATFFRYRTRLEIARRVIRSAVNGNWQLVTARPEPSPTPEQQALQDQIDRAESNPPEEPPFEFLPDVPPGKSP